MKILSLVNTDGLDYDDRVNKEAQILMGLGNEVSLLALELANKPRSGTTAYGAPFRTVALSSRKFFPRRRFLMIKAFEMYLRFAGRMGYSGWDVLWVHEHSPAGMIVIGWLLRKLGKRLRIVWDQHELWPESLVSKTWYHWLLACCDVIVVANQERADVIKSLVPAQLTDRLFVVENYPDRSLLQASASPLADEFQQWLGTSPYVLFQGGAWPHRKILECAEAVNRLGNLRMLVMGPCEDSVRDDLAVRWPDYQDWIFITGWIAPSRFLSYMDQASASLVFYENIDQNHWLCAPNRFYHAIIRGIPVICGPNPPMKQLVDQYGIGQVVNGNGEIPDEIEQALRAVLAHHAKYKDSCLRCREKFVWDTQESVLISILQKLAG